MRDNTVFLKESTDTWELLEKAGVAYTTYASFVLVSAAGFKKLMAACENSMQAYNLVSRNACLVPAV